MASSDDIVTSSGNDAEALYIRELKELYGGLTPTQTSSNQWPPSCTRKVFNLAMVKEEQVERGQIKDTFVRMTITGKLDDILHVKYPIKLENIFKDVEKGRRKVVLMEGAPGCGKSTLSIFISQQWGEGKLFKEYKAVILVQLRDPIVQKAKSILDLIPKSKDTSIAQNAEKEMRSNDFQDVLFILDGWDELPSSLHEDPESVFHTLIEDDLAKKNGLLKSAVVITSRPIASGKLQKIVSARVEILGFTPKELTDYFNECLEGDTEAVKILQERIEENPAIASSCYLPLNASILVHIFKDRQCNHLPTSQYGVFSLLICTCVTRHLKERTIHKNLCLESLEQLVEADVIKEPFKFLCELAYKSVMDNLITFSSLPGNVNTLSLLQGVESFVRSAEKVLSYNFIHLSIQELLAAFFMVRWLTASEQVYKFIELFGQPRFNAVFQFYASITKLQAPGIKVIIARVAKQCAEPNPEDKVKVLLVSLLHCLSEAQDSSLCEFILQYLEHGLNLGHTTLSPADCLSIGYFLSCVCNMTSGYEEFRVSPFNCNIGDQGCKYLVKGIQKCLGESSGPKKTMLNLNLRWNGIHEEGGIELCKLLKLNCVSVLALNGNEELSDEGIFHIAKHLRDNVSLKELNLYTCGLKAEGLGYIAKALESNSTLITLNVGGNGLCNEGVKSLAQALQVNHGLKSLNLSSCGMTDAGLQHLADSLQQNDTLAELKLYNFQNQPHLNEFMDSDGIKYLTKSLKENTTLISLSLPADFEPSILDISEVINQERRLNGIAMVKVKKEGHTLSWIRGKREKQQLPDTTKEREGSSPPTTKDTNVSPLCETYQDGYICVAHSAVGFVYLPNSVNFSNINIKSISDITMYPKMSANEVILTPVVSIISLKEMLLTDKPMIVELMKTTQLLDRGDKKLVPVFSDTHQSSPLNWKAITGAECEEIEDRFIFKSTHFSYTTVIACFSPPTASVKVNPYESEANSHVQLKIPELPGFEVNISSHSVQTPTNIKATLYYDDAEACKESENQSLATACVMLEPHGQQFSMNVSVQIPIPEYSRIKEENPDATLQLMISSSGSSDDWVKHDDMIIKEIGGEFVATLSINHFSRLKINWSLTYLVATFKNLFTRVKSLLRRCQVFMTHEIRVGSIINFSIRVLVCPFQDSPLEMPTNYYYVLYDSGNTPIEFKPGKQKLQIKLKDYLVTCKAEKRVVSKTFHISEDSTAIAEFDVDLNKESERMLVDGAVLANLSIIYSATTEHDCNLIKKSQRKKRKRIQSEEVRGSIKIPRVQKSASLDEVEQRARVLEQIIDSEQEEDQSVVLEEVTSTQNFKDPKMCFGPSSHSITTFIKWRNKQGKEEEFRLNQLGCHKWKEIGRRLKIPDPLLIAWEKEHLKNQLECTNTVLCHWLENPTDCYPKSWDGLQRLLKDVQLSEIAIDLKRALDNVV